jgi:hypothetical protein
MRGKKREKGLNFLQLIQTFFKKKIHVESHFQHNPLIHILQLYVT